MIKRILGFIAYIIYKYVVRDEYKSSIGYWFFVNGNESYLLNHQLGPDSTVLEVGGYTGVFAERLSTKFNSEVYVFEPVKEYFETLEHKFNSKKNVHLFNMGLAGKTRTEFIVKYEDGSSIFRSGAGREEEIKLVDIKDFLEKNKLGSIDLMNINIEGGEYELLERMLEVGLVDSVDFLQVQFHKLGDNFLQRREKIITELQKTHIGTFSFPFVWEGFRRKS